LRGSLNKTAERTIPLRSLSAAIRARRNDILSIRVSLGEVKTVIPSKMNPCRLRFLASLLLAASCSGLTLGQQTSSPSPKVTSVGELDAGCAKCHAEIYKRYLTTPMANASGLAMEGINPGSYSDPSSGVTYRVVEKQGAAWLIYDRPGEKNLHGEQKLEYFMGSGNHARTYLYSIKGYWFESPIVYYREKAGYDMRPSFQGQKEMPFNLPQNAECMRCHMNGTQVEDPGTRNHYKGLPFLHGGIACEDCHGDTSAHLSRGAKGPILKLAKLDADRQASVCLLCHLEGDVNVEHRGKSVMDYKPGGRIADYISYFVRANSRATKRGVSQVEGLSLSMCKRASGDKMSCTTCHDPHSTPSAEERTAFFRAKCLTCHTDAKYANTHFKTTPDCTSCHMPRREAPDLAHSVWTDHRLLARPGADTPEPTSGETVELVSVSGIASEATPRDVALAYYKLVAGGELAAAERAHNLLQDVVSADPADSEATAALGFLSYLHGDQQKATALFESTLSADPNNFNVAIDLGVLLARSGKLQRAADLWSSTFERNEDITELGLNTAKVQCVLGQRAAAEDILRRVLIYSPDHRGALQELSAIESGRQACPPRSDAK
jgi:predicted CXXCH cytochrome family protein